ncbi:hypothetical protein PIB30_041982 [Stylosanthes scabra]|uniref:Uncharacterized protein n=1 Tax=Stylosanthes scabra TaxID=79078 RepID=A0ABU6YE02_9FABA|nr:hypothetical protein [Stylosanthes scabra]
MTRCSPSELAKTYIGFSNQKKALVHEMGFGALAENVSNYNFSNLIMMELVDSFHIPDNTIRTNIGRFKVDATKVGHALGLNAMGGLYRQKMLKKEVPREQYEAADKFRKKSLADLRDMMTQIKLDTEEDITNFKRAFECPPCDFMLQGLAHQTRSRTPKRTQKKIKTKIKIPPTKNEIMNNTLAKSLQIEGPSQKILGKRKQTEEEKSSSESELEMESESESESKPESE